LAANSIQAAPPTGVRLYNREPRAPLTMRGVAALILGGCSILAGVPAILFGMRRFGINVRNVTEDVRIAVGLFGCSLLLVGVLSVISGLRDLLRKSRRPESIAEPWRWEYPWNPRQIADGTGDDLVKSIWTAFIFGLFILPFHWMFVRLPNVPIVFPIVFAIFDLALVALFVRAAYLGARLLRYGKTRAACNTFPFFLGSTLAVDLELPRGVAGAEPVTATLRCIQETYQQDEDSTSTILTEVYSATQALSIAPTPTGSARARAEFQLPDGDLGTRLEMLPPRYWELELVSRKPGVDYRARLMMPVYARS
jgi:hypothetical protein